MVLLPFNINPWALDQCYSLFSQHHTTHHRKTGALTAPTQHSCTKGLQHHPTLLESSPKLTCNGLTQNLHHAERSLATLKQPQPPAYTQSNLWDLASPKPLAHFYAQLPVHFHSPYTQHSTSTHSSLQTIHMTYVGGFLN
jgi:hypothetical protein